MDQFAEVFFKLKPDQKPTDHPKLNACLDPAVDRFAALEKEQQDQFRDVLIAYRNLYGFMSQIVPFSDLRLEKLHAYGRMLLRKLPRPDDAGPIDLGDDVALHSLVIKKAAEGALDMKQGLAAREALARRPHDASMVWCCSAGCRAALPPYQGLPRDSETDRCPQSTRCRT